MMRRTLAVFGTAVMVAGTLAACGSSGGSSGAASGRTTGSGNSGSKSPVKIAVLEPFSGSFGYLGTFIKNSMQIEVDKINAAGGLLGHKIQIITRDDQLSAQATVSAARELASDPSVKLISGPSITAFYDAVRSIYNQNKQLNCPTSVDAQPAPGSAPYTFIAGPNNSVWLTPLLDYLSKKAGAKTIGVVYSHDASGQALDKALKTLAPKFNLKYLGIQYYNEGAQNQLAQVRALEDADALFVSGVGPDAAETAISAQQVGYKGTLVGTDGLQSYVFVDGAGNSAVGTTFSSEPLYNLTQTPESQWPGAYRQFYDTAVSKYGVKKGPKSGVEQLQATPLAAACVVAWAKAVKTAGTFDPDKVKSAWETETLPADENPAGTSVQFSPSNHDFFNNANEIAVYEWQHANGKWYLKTVKQAG